MDSSPGNESRSGRKHHWSYSKSTAYDACPLKVFFRGSASDESSEGTGESSRPVNLNAIVGIAVHRGIASQVDEWAAGGSATYVGAKEAAEEWIEDIWDVRDERVIEAINGEQLSAGQRRKFIGISKRYLRTFFKAIWPEFRDHKYVLHEDLQRFEVRGNPVYVKVDFCTRDQNDNLVITDWKTSKPPILEFESLQLNVYGLWARECMESDINKIKIQFGHTRTGGTPSHSVASEDLDDVAEQIEQECREWNEKDGIDDYPADPETEKCHGCQFLKRCDAGQATVD